MAFTTCIICLKHSFRSYVKTWKLGNKVPKQAEKLKSHEMKR